MNVFFFHTKKNRIETAKSRLTYLFVKFFIPSKLLKKGYE